jgi:hypothetical protein
MLPLTENAPKAQIWSCSKDEIARKTLSFDKFSVLVSQTGVN